VTNDDKFAEGVQALRNHGIKIKNGKVDFIYAGFNYRMTDFQAALGLCQLSEIEKIIQTRIQVAKEYDEKLARIPWIKIPTKFEDRKAVYQTYHVLFDQRIDRDKLINSLKETGIETNFGGQALHCLTYYKDKYNYKETDFPNAGKAYKKGLALPMGIHLMDKDVLFVCERILKVLSKEVADD